VSEEATVFSLAARAEILRNANTLLSGKVGRQDLVSSGWVSTIARGTHRGVRSAMSAFAASERTRS
jgi:hypothetical protein